MTAAGAALAADPALERAAASMRVGDLKSVRYTGDGVGWTFGQAFEPGGAWPKVRLNPWSRTIDYAAGAMRDDNVLTRAEATGGGGYPHTAPQRNEQYLHGTYAWNQGPTGPAPGPRFVMDRYHALWISPHGVLRAALRNDAKVARRVVDGRTVTTVAFTEPGRFRAVATVDGGRVVRVDSRVPDPTFGETDVVTTYGAYQDFGGFPFPTRITQAAGGNDGRTLPVLEQVKKLAPGKPIRYVVNSHAHFDHTGGVRAAVGDGATLVTDQRGKAFFERALATRGTIAPDHLTKSGRKAKVVGVNGRHVLTDGTRSVELLRVDDSNHSDAMLMMYLPEEKLLIEADAFTPGPPNAPPPAQVNPLNANLVENLAKFGRPIDRILPLHGRVVPVAELYTAVGAKSPY